MDKHYLKVISLCLLFSCVIVANGTSQRRLLDLILRNYDKVLKPDGIVTVTHRLSLTNIISYDNNIITANVWVFQQWIDNRLQWDSTDGPNRLTVPARLLWKPDILLYNNIGQDSGIIYDDLNVVIEPNGQVTYVPAMRLTSQCSETGLMRKSITCKWKFGSWTYSANDIDFNSASNISLSEYQHNQRFDITETKAIVASSYYECCPEPYPDVTYTLEFRKSFL